MYLSSFLDYEKKYKRGTYTNIKYKKKDGTYRDCVVRLGVKPKEYKSTGLSYGEWAMDKYVFYHVVLLQISCGLVSKIST